MNHQEPSSLCVADHSMRCPPPSRALLIASVPVALGLFFSLPGRLRRLGQSYLVVRRPGLYVRMFFVLHLPMRLQVHLLLTFNTDCCVHSILLSPTLRILRVSPLLLWASTRRIQLPKRAAQHLAPFRVTGVCRGRREREQGVEVCINKDKGL